MDPFTILSAFVPLLVEGGKKLINRFTDGVKPASVEDLIAIGELEIRKLEAIAKLDSSERVSRWVANIRGLQRPILAFIVLIAWLFVVVGDYPIGVLDLTSNLASTVMFYMFGDRTLMYLKQKR